MFKNFKKRLFFLPSLITCCSILCGLWAIFIAFNEYEIEGAIVLIIIGAIFDAFDGRVARFLGVRGNFGIELDSLADFLTFGVAPSFIYLQSFNWNNELMAFSFLTIFPVCMSLRLARFNMQALMESKNPELLEFRKNFFFGLAAPVGAITLLLPVIITFSGYNIFICSDCLLIYSFIISLFLIIPVPIFAHKRFHVGVKKRRDVIFTIIAVSFITILCINPIKGILLASVVYGLSIPVSIAVYIIGKNRILERESKGIIRARIRRIGERARNTAKRFKNVKNRFNKNAFKSGIGTKRMAKRKRIIKRNRFMER